MDVTSAPIMGYYTKCGTGNRRILENIRLLGNVKKPMWIRIPLVDGENTVEEELHAMADFLLELPSVRQVDLFPVMNHAQDKYRALNLEDERFNEEVDGHQLLESARLALQQRSGGRLNVRSLL